MAHAPAQAWLEHISARMFLLVTVCPQYLTVRVRPGQIAIATACCGAGEWSLAWSRRAISPGDGGCTTRDVLLAAMACSRVAYQDGSGRYRPAVHGELKDNPIPTSIPHQRRPGRRAGNGLDTPGHSRTQQDRIEDLAMMKRMGGREGLVAVAPCLCLCLCLCRRT